MFETINREETYSVKYEERIKKFGTDDLLPMWVADMDLASPQCVQEALQKRATHPIYGYTIYPSHYYQAIIDWYHLQYNTTIQKEWIVPASGVVPSLYLAVSLFSSEQDGVIIQSPIYPPFFTAIKHQKRKILDNTLLYHDGRYTIDMEDFATKAKDAKLFLLCSPHNPTGRSWSDEELKAMILVCMENDIVIVSDEIHADIVYQVTHHIAISLCQKNAQIIILNAPSKSFNIAGLNTSYAIIPNDTLRQKFTIGQMRLGQNHGNPFGIEALIAAYQNGSQWLASLKIHLKENIDYIQTFLQTHQLPIKAVKSEATYLLWLDCSQMKLSQEALVIFWTHKAKLGLNDGISFGKAGEGFMRLNIATSKAVIKEAMQRLLRACRLI